MSLADRLTAARAAAGLSQQAVADATGITRTGISDLEHDKRRVEAGELKSLAELYGTTPGALLGTEEATPSIRTPEGLMARLETVTNNLYSYLSARAQELAEPHIQVAEEAANRRVRDAEFQLERQQALVAELRVQLDHALRDAAFARHKAYLHHDKAFCRTCQEEKTEKAEVAR